MLEGYLGGAPGGMWRWRGGRDEGVWRGGVDGLPARGVDGGETIGRRGRLGEKGDCNQNPTGMHFGTELASPARSTSGDSDRLDGEVSSSVVASPCSAEPRGWVCMEPRVQRLEITDLFCNANSWIIRQWDARPCLDRLATQSNPAPLTFLSLHCGHPRAERTHNNGPNQRLRNQRPSQHPQGVN